VPVLCGRCGVFKDVTMGGFKNVFSSTYGKEHDEVAQTDPKYGTI